MTSPSSPRVPRPHGSNTRHVRHTRNTANVLVSASQPDFAEPLVAWLAGNAKTDPELRLRYRQALEVDGGSQRGDARMLWESIRPVAA